MLSKALILLTAHAHVASHSDLAEDSQIARCDTESRRGRREISLVQVRMHPD